MNKGLIILAVALSVMLWGVGLAMRGGVAISLMRSYAVPCDGCDGGGGGAAYCGNAVCESGSGETCSSCARDCGTCPAPPQPAKITCGSIGGNWCSEGGSCPSTFKNLGKTSDCNPCCQGLSCYNLGGNYCSEKSGCPIGYAKLGRSYDCLSCCKK